MHHRAGLARELEAEGIEAQAAADFMDAIERVAVETGSFPPEATARERAILGYALRLTREPASMRADHLDPLRSAGLDDRAILEVNQVAAYFAYVNRVVDGLGVELEPEREP